MAIGGNVTGNINTGTQINTKGGAYFGGNVQAGRDLVGGDKIVHGDEINGDSYRFNVDRDSAVKINEGAECAKVADRRSTKAACPQNCLGTLQ